MPEPFFPHMSVPPKAFILGWPLGHTLSPILHGYWLAEHAIAGAYEAVPLPPESLEPFLAKLPGSPWRGGNVTIPHKERALALAGRPDGLALAIGAANTLWLENGAICATNTDAYGFTASLDQECPGWEGNGVALVLGAGGAARAVVHALIGRGLERIHICNRTLSRATALAGHFGGPCHAHGLDAVAGLLPGAGLLVNTTSLGMSGNEGLVPDLAAAADNLVVSDIVYAPPLTPLLAQAGSRRLRAVGGLGMLMHQAAAGFERWFGVRPTVSEGLRRTLEAELERRQAGR
jgi:shikimate dehydrogenase